MILWEIVVWIGIEGGIAERVVVVWNGIVDEVWVGFVEVNVRMRTCVDVDGGVVRCLVILLMRCLFLGT